MSGNVFRMQEGAAKHELLRSTDQLDDFAAVTGGAAAVTGNPLLQRERSLSAGSLHTVQRRSRTISPAALLIAVALLALLVALFVEPEQLGRLFSPPPPPPRRGWFGRRL